MLKHFVVVALSFVLLLVSCNKQEQKETWTWEQESNTLAASLFSMEEVQDKYVFPTEGELILRKSSAIITFKVPVQENSVDRDTLIVSFKPSAVENNSSQGIINLYSHDSSGIVECTAFFSGYEDDFSIVHHYDARYSFDINLVRDAGAGTSVGRSFSGSAILRAETSDGYRMLFNITKLSVK